MGSGGRGWIDLVGIPMMRVKRYIRRVLPDPLSVSDRAYTPSYPEPPNPARGRDRAALPPSASPFIPFSPSPPLPISLSPPSPFSLSPPCPMPPPPSFPPSTPLRLRQILHPRRRALTTRPDRILRHKHPRLHAALDVVEIPDLVQRAAGALDDGRDAAGFLQGREDGGGGVGLRGGGEDGGCGEELRGREVSGGVMMRAKGGKGLGLGLGWGRGKGQGQGKGG